METVKRERLVISMSGKVAHIAKSTMRQGSWARTQCGITMHVFHVSREKCAANGWTVCATCQAKVN